MRNRIGLVIRGIVGLMFVAFLAIICPPFVFVIWLVSGKSFVDSCFKFLDVGLSKILKDKDQGL